MIMINSNVFRTLFLLIALLFCLTAWPDNAKESVLVGMGNSIGAGTFAVSAKGMPRDPEMNWWYQFVLKVISLESHSFLSRIEQMLEADPSANSKWKRHNLAIPGHDLGDILRVQLPEALKLQPDLIYVEAFANDVCATDPSGMTSFEKYFSELSYLTHELMENTNAIIVLVAAPDLSLQSNLNREKKMWWPASWVFGTYGDMWERTQLCNTLTTGKYTELVRKRLELYNAAMEGLAIAYSDRICYTYGSAMQTFENKHLSWVDKFHPSKAGQQYLASKAYAFSGTCTQLE